MHLLIACQNKKINKQIHKAVIKIQQLIKIQIQDKTTVKRQLIKTQLRGNQMKMLYRRLLINKQNYLLQWMMVQSNKTQSRYIRRKFYKSMFYLYLDIRFEQVTMNAFSKLIVIAMAFYFLTIRR